jgi:hypothetical protein
MKTEYAEKFQKWSKLKETAGKSTGKILLTLERIFASFLFLIFVQCYGVFSL